MTSNGIQFTSYKHLNAYNSNPTSLCIVLPHTTRSKTNLSLISKSSVTTILPNMKFVIQKRKISPCSPSTSLANPKVACSVPQTLSPNSTPSDMSRDISDSLCPADGNTDVEVKFHVVGSERVKQRGFLMLHLAHMSTCYFGYTSVRFFLVVEEFGDK